jgi:hypothetical protein
MGEKERSLLIKINETIKKLNTPPPPTFSPQTGETKEPGEFTPVRYPSLPLPPIQPQR